MDELIAFVRRCVDDDERVARQMTADPCGFYIEAETDQTNIMTVGAHIYRWTPKRVLAEVKAKRAILDWCERTARIVDEIEAWGIDASDVVEQLAQPFAGRDGWREEWRAVPLA